MASLKFPMAATGCIWEEEADANVRHLDAGRSLIKTTVSLNLRRGRASPVLAMGQGTAGTCDIIGHDWNLGIEHSRRKWSRVIRGGGPSPTHENNTDTFGSQL